MSSKRINIGGDENDPNYRYKMAPLQTKIEGRGNGIKTVLMNITNVAKDMRIQPQYVTKYFGMDVGALSKYDDKRNVGIVHGVHQTSELQQSLKKFISNFILCPKCKLPELEMRVNSKRAILLQRCASCGWKGENASSHKVKTYIISHPMIKKNKNTKNIKTKNREIFIKNKKKEKVVVPISIGVIDEQWSVDTTEDAVRQRKQQEMATVARGRIAEVSTADTLTNNRKTHSMMNENIGSKNSPSVILRNFIISKKRNVYEILDEVKRIGLARNYDQQKKVQITLEAICNFQNLETFLITIERHSLLLKQFNNGENECKIFFGCIEEIIARRNAMKFMKNSYLIVQALYDYEIVSEEQILKWYSMPADEALIVEKEEAADIKAKSKPFIVWLQEAESDEDDE